MEIFLLILNSYFAKIVVCEEIGQGNKISLIKIGQGNELVCEKKHVIGWMDGWMGVKAVLRIANSNQT